MDWFDHQYLIDIYEDVNQTIVIKKGAQIGITTYAMIKDVWFADGHNVSTIYTMPTDGDVSSFSRARMSPMILNSPYLSRMISDINAVGLKQIGNSFMYFKGAWSERQAISVDSDFNIHDEIDFSKPDIIDMYRERMSHSKYKWFLALSTPTIPEYGIDYMFNRSDKKEWFITCPKCQKEQIMKFPDSIKGDTKEARFACLYCKATITNDARRQGHWVATGDKDWGVSGYHISQLMAPWISATEILRKEESCRIRPTKELGGIKDFYNFVLGEAYGGENQPINRELLLSCIQNKFSMEKMGMNTVMGIDQGDRLHVVIYNKERDGLIRLIHSGVYTDFDVDLPNLVEKYGVTFAIIDALPNKHSARTFALKYPGKVWMVYYNDQQKEPIKWYQDEETKERRIIANKIDTLDNMSARFKNHQIILPQLTQPLDEFIRHLCNWAKDKEEKPDGRVVWVYKKLGADHLTMASNYAMLAIDKISTGSLAENKSGEIPASERTITHGIMDTKF